MIQELSIKINRSDTAFANAISWVTISIVMPFCLSVRIIWVKSSTDSLSSALVGSSNKMNFGCVNRARVIFFDFFYTSCDLCFF
jgi:hypothetical protein